jgi:hypothetical protein
MDLGVEINSDLSFQSHIGSIVSKARQRVGVLFRGFHTRQVSFLKKAYITYIRPLLEYNSNIWNPTHVYLIDLMENVQRAFTKHVKAISKLPYIERLGIFNLEPLELRRLRYDLVQYYKILNNLTLESTQLTATALEIENTLRHGKRPTNVRLSCILW